MDNTGRSISVLNEEQEPVEVRVGRELKHIRNSRHKTLEDLEKITGLSYNTINRIELGKTRARLDILERIANGLGCEITFRPIEK